MKSRHVGLYKAIHSRKKITMNVITGLNMFIVVQLLLDFMI